MNQGTKRCELNNITESLGAIMAFDFIAVMLQHITVKTTPPNKVYSAALCTYYIMHLLLLQHKYFVSEGTIFKEWYRL